MINVRLEVEASRAVRKIRSLTETRTVRSALRVFGKKVESQYRDATPTSDTRQTGAKSGKLKKSWFHRVEQDGEDSVTLFVRNKDPKAEEVLPILLYGSKPHRIEPKSGTTALRYFTMRSFDALFRSTVNHPGTKPNKELRQLHDVEIPRQIKGLTAHIAKLKADAANKIR